MQVEISLWHIVSLAAMLIGGYWALIKLLIAQFNRTLDVRFKAQEEARTQASASWQRSFEQLATVYRSLQAGQKKLEERFNKHLAELPIHYQRREDAIRQEVAIISRLDALANLVEKKHEGTEQKIEALRRQQ